MTTEGLIKTLSREQLDALLEALTLPEDADDVDAGYFDIVVSLTELIADGLRGGESDAKNQEV